MPPPGRGWPATPGGPPPPLPPAIWRPQISRIKIELFEKGIAIKAAPRSDEMGVYLKGQAVYVMALGVWHLATVTYAPKKRKGESFFTVTPQDKSIEPLSMALSDHDSYGDDPEKGNTWFQTTSLVLCSYFGDCNYKYTSADGHKCAKCGGPIHSLCQQIFWEKKEVAHIPGSYYCRACGP